MATSSTKIQSYLKSSLSLNYNQSSVTRPQTKTNLPDYQIESQVTLSKYACERFTLISKTGNLVVMLV